jgi:hypothetical protein
MHLVKGPSTCVRFCIQITVRFRAPFVDARQRNERNALMGAAERYGFASELFLDQLILLES